MVTYCFQVANAPEIRRGFHMTKKSSHLAKAIKSMYKHINTLNNSDKSRLEKDILETIIDHVNSIDQKNRGVNYEK